jgi:hypothetical protein
VLQTHQMRRYVCVNGNASMPQLPRVVNDLRSEADRDASNSNSMSTSTCSRYRAKSCHTDSERSWAQLENEACRETDLYSPRAVVVSPSSRPTCDDQRAKPALSRLHERGHSSPARYITSRSGLILRFRSHQQRLARKIVSTIKTDEDTAVGQSSVTSLP